MRTRIYHDANSAIDLSVDKENHFCELETLDGSKRQMFYTVDDWDSSLEWNELRPSTKCLLRVIIQEALR
jgi:hypothetical protein